MKKKLTIIFIILAVVLIIGAIFLVRARNRSQIDNDQAELSTVLETLLIDRPYVSLIPRADGKEFTLEISRIKNVEIIEYELVYESEGLSRGVIGSIEISSGETKVSRKLLLGTCSRDVCKYDEGIEQGSLTLRFRSSEGARKFETDFHLQQGDQELISIDENFKLAGKFSPSAFYITMATIGLPQEVKEEVFVEPYGIFTASSSSAKDSILTMVLAEETTEAKLMFWDGNKLAEQEEIEIENNLLTATVDSLGAFFITE